MIYRDRDDDEAVLPDDAVNELLDDEDGEGTPEVPEEEEEGRGDWE